MIYSLCYALAEGCLTQSGPLFQSSEAALCQVELFLTVKHCLLWAYTVQLNMIPCLAASALVLPKPQGCRKVGYCRPLLTWLFVPPEMQLFCFRCGLLIKLLSILCFWGCIKVLLYVWTLDNLIWWSFHGLRVYWVKKEKKMVLLNWLSSLSFITHYSEKKK